MNFYTFISKKEGRLYGGIFALCLIYLVAIQGYATGYEWEKFTLMNWLWQLWSKPGGDWNFGVFVLLCGIQS